MSKEYINKVNNFFGTFGLIIQGKANQFYQSLTLSQNDVVTLYDIVTQPNSPFKNYMRNYVLCTLYYQSYYYPQAIRSFFEYASKEFRENRDTSLSKERLYFIFNIAEFAYKHHKFDQNALSFLINQLNSFGQMTKNLEEFILFKLYSAVLLYEYKDYSKSNEVCYETIPYVTDALERSNKTQSSNNLYKYIELNIRMIMLMNEKEDPKHDLIEYGAMAAELYSTLVKINIPTAIKVGFNLFDIYLKKGEINNCLEICQNMKTIINTELFRGAKINDGYFIYLALSSRKAFAYAFMQNNTKALKTIKHIEDDIKFLNESLPKERVTKRCYELYCSMYKFNLDRSQAPKEKINTVLDNFKNIYEREIAKVGYKVFNMNEIYLNILVINENHGWGMYAQNYLTSLMAEVKADINKIRAELIPSLIFGIYNRISSLTKSITSDPSANKQMQYKQSVRQYAEDLNFIIQNIHHMFPIFKMDYIKTAIVKIMYAYFSTYLLDGNIEQLKTEFKNFENSSYGCVIIKEDASSTEKLPCFGCLYKLKGDINYRLKNYMGALEYYLEANKRFAGEYSNESASTKLSIGVCYAFIKNKEKCINFLEEALDGFMVLIQNEIQRKDNDAALRYETKIKKVENLISALSK
ncbi:MAG: tetratricopeptide repeat protein [archaeon]|nr:tetratricopeptide repeat protein [archaeon]